MTHLASWSAVAGGLLGLFLVDPKRPAPPLPGKRREPAVSIFSITLLRLEGGGELGVRGPVRPNGNLRRAPDLSRTGAARSGVDDDGRRLDLAMSLSAAKNASILKVAIVYFRWYAD